MGMHGPPSSFLIKPGAQSQPGEQCLNIQVLPGSKQVGGHGLEHILKISLSGHCGAEKGRNNYMGGKL